MNVHPKDEKENDRQRHRNMETMKNVKHKLPYKTCECLLKNKSTVVNFGSSQHYKTIKHMCLLLLVIVS